jgi:hypothetical protein
MAAVRRFFIPLRRLREVSFASLLDPTHVVHGFGQALTGSRRHPLFREDVIGWDAATVVIDGTEAKLGFGQSVLGRLLMPANSFELIRFHPAAPEIPPAQQELSLGITRFRRLSQQRNGRIGPFLLNGGHGG